MRKLITIIIILAAVGGAVVLGYRAFSTGSGSTPATLTTSQILPYGSELKFDSVKKYNKDGKIFQYPVVSAGEIGPDLNTVIK